MLAFRTHWIARLRTGLHELGPYAAIALALPGGTLLLVSLWVFRHRRWMLAQLRFTVAKRLVRMLLPYAFASLASCASVGAPLSYPLHGAFNFNPASGGAPCPADDRFIGRFVALER
jgi:hypothetical protein